MQIRRLTIKGFRGIRRFVWCPESALSCLIGPGDSTKTTILDAIELVLSPRWRVSITDADFHGGNCNEPISITATIGQLPGSLLAEDKYGMELRGWNEEGGLKDEPEEDDESVLTIRFSVDDSLEPNWVVVNARRPEGRHMPARDREALGLVRLGGDIDRHLAWGRGSALSRTTDGIEEVGRVVAAAQREAREAVAKADLTKLKAAAAKAKEAAVSMGVRVLGEYRPALDALLSSGGAGQLSLHEDEIPVRATGLGSRRLTALALQSMAVKEGGILLIDEIEHGLEPHRLRHLLQVLRAAPKDDQGQVFMTTHSPIPIAELGAEDLCVTRCLKGTTKARRVSAELQDIVRKTPEALLGRKVLVCEGKTELGLCRALEAQWAEARGGLPLAHTGTVLTHGSGKEAPQIALKVASLGYATALLIDSDQPLTADVVAGLAKAQVRVIAWADMMATEERIALDLPWVALQEVVSLAVSLKGEQSVADAVRARLPRGPAISGAQIDQWKELGFEEDQIRQAIGKAAKHKDSGWFKRIDWGQGVGAIVAEALPVIPTSDLAEKLDQVAAWAYAD
jgi:hypothetical protein